MSSGKSARDLLCARETRQAALGELLRREARSTLMLSLNIPGLEKTPPGCEGLFEWMRGQIASAFSGQWVVEEGRDALGQYLLASLDIDAIELKRRCIAWETAFAAGRLIDLDVYGAQGNQLDRQSLALPARTCLICDQPAVECMRNRRHEVLELVDKINELLAPFVA